MTTRPCYKSRRKTNWRPVFHIITGHDRDGGSDSLAPKEVKIAHITPPKQLEWYANQNERMQRTPLAWISYKACLKLMEERPCVHLPLGNTNLSSGANIKQLVFHWTLRLIQSWAQLISTWQGLEICFYFLFKQSIEPLFEGIQELSVMPHVVTSNITRYVTMGISTSTNTHLWAKCHLVTVETSFSGESWLTFCH